MCARTPFRGKSFHIRDQLYTLCFDGLRVSYHQDASPRNCCLCCKSHLSRATFHSTKPSFFFRCLEISNFSPRSKKSFLLFCPLFISRAHSEFFHTTFILSAITYMFSVACIRLASKRCPGYSQHDDLSIHIRYALEDDNLNA